MVEQVGAFSDQMRAIVFDCCDYGFDCFLAELLGAMFRALVEQLAGVRRLTAGRRAGVDGLGKIVDRETRHTKYSTHGRPAGPAGRCSTFMKRSRYASRRMGRPRRTMCSFASRI